MTAGVRPSSSGHGARPGSSSSSLTGAPHLQPPSLLSPCAGAHLLPGTLRCSLGHGTPPPSAPFSRHPRRAPSLLLSVSAEARTVPIPRAAKAMARQRPAGCSAPPAGSAHGGGHGRARARICAPLAELRGGLERGSFARGGLAAANGVATAMGMVDGGSSFRSEPRREGGVVGTPRRYRVVRTTRGVADGGRNGNIAYHLQSLVPCCSHFYGKSVLQYWEADGFQYPLRPALALSPSLDPRNCPNNVAR